MHRLVPALPFIAVLVAPALADDAEVTITLKDHQFVPSEVPVPAGVKVKLLVKNEQRAAAEVESKVLHFEKIAGPGREISVYVGPLAPGSYESYNDFDYVARGHSVVK